MLCKSKETQCAIPSRSWNGVTGFSDHRTMKCRGGYLENMAGLEAKSSVTVKFNGATLKISQKRLR